MRVIAQMLKLKSCSRVTQLVDECERLMRRDKPLRDFIAELRLALT